MVNKFNDGLTSKSSDTEITIGVSGINLVDLDISWKFEDVRIVQNPREGFPGVISNCLNPDYRLVIEDDELFARIKTNISKLRINFIYFKEFCAGNKKLLSLLLIAVLALPFSLKFLSNQLDDEFMTKVGDNLVKVFVSEKNQCSNQEGIKALQKLVNEISGEKKSYKVFVIKKDSINAIALPGGSIIIYSKLLDRFENPDELAFILGHEIGHVKQEHHKYSFIIGNFLSRINSALSFLVQMKYSRSGEIEADEFGYNLMISNNINPAYGISAFGRLRSDDDLETNMEKLLSYISSHPATDDRIQIIKERIRDISDDKIDNFSQVVSDEDWEKIQGICE